MNMIRHATSNDITRIAEIHLFTRRLAYRGIAPDDYLFNKNGIKERLDFFTDNLHDVFVYDDGIIKGFISVGSSPDADAADFFELGRIYVEPLFQGEGIGEKMIIFFEEEAHRRGFRKTCLWVLEKNTKARKFYEKMGYAPDGAFRYAKNYEATHIRHIKTEVCHG